MVLDNVSPNGAKADRTNGIVVSNLINIEQDKLCGRIRQNTVERAPNAVTNKERKENANKTREPDVECETRITKSWITCEFSSKREPDKVKQDRSTPSVGMPPGGRIGVRYRSSFASRLKFPATRLRISRSIKGNLLVHIEYLVTIMAASGCQ